LGSVVSLLAQASLALFLLGFFEPQAVGQFSVVAQIAFGWATLALAQSPVSLLANQHLAPLPAARLAWRHSLRRWGLLALPAACAVVWSNPWAQPGHPAWAWLMAWTWAAAIAWAQMGWLLSQSLTLRQGSPASVALVRMLPPVLAAALAASAALALHWRNAQALSSAALLGYAAGALWLLPALRLGHPSDGPTRPTTPPDGAGDGRSERLKFIHTLSDVALATLLAVQWSAVHGAAQAGCLLILLRVMGFVPALVSTAWAQVVLSRPTAPRPSSVWAAWVGVSAVATVGLGTDAAWRAGWLPEGWAALQDYIWPLAAWQMAASAMAAASHRPFLHGAARPYTLQCLAMNAMQAMLMVLPPALGWPVVPHLWALAGFATLALCLQAWWAARLGPVQADAPL
jgi:hypothetical protein